jgi:hypothetical protein
MRACKSCEAAHKPPCREAHQPRRCRTTHTSTGLVALQSAPTRTRDLLRRLRPVVDAGCSVRSAAALTESSTVVPSVLSSSQPNKRAHSARLAAGYVKTRVVLDSPCIGLLLHVHAHDGDADCSPDGCNWLQAGRSLHCTRRISVEQALLCQLRQHPSFPR